MALLLAVGLIAGGAPAASAEANASITVSPPIISDFPTVLTVEGSGFKLDNANRSLCSITSIDNTFVGYAYGPTGDYNPMRALPARVINSTHLTCETVRLNNPAPATVKVSMDGGVSWVTTSGTAPSVSILPLVEVAVGRRPYTSEAEGQLIVKVAGPPLLPSGAAVHVSAALPSAVHATPLLHGAPAATGKVSLLPFPLGGLPATVLADLAITVALPSPSPGMLAAPRTASYAKNFQRAPPPQNGNITVVVVDHLSRGMLLGRGSSSGSSSGGGGGAAAAAAEEPWLPFLAVGWFNSAFTYAGQGVGDHSFAPPPSDVDPLLVAGAGRSVEWARKGVNLVRMGASLPHDRSVPRHPPPLGAWTATV
jgi:hypothetical protein